MSVERLIARANDFLHRYALLLLLVFFIFALFDLFYAAPAAREIKARESLLEAGRERLEGFNKELARVKGHERAAAGALAAILADTAGYGAPTGEAALLHRIVEAADAAGLSTGPIAVKRSASPGLSAALVGFEFDWAGEPPALDRFLAALEAAPEFVTLDVFRIERARGEGMRGSLTATLRVRPAR